MARTRPGALPDLWLLLRFPAAAMMISMLRKEYTAGKGSTVRSRMVLFLVAGDFFLGCVSHPARLRSSRSEA